MVVGQADPERIEKTPASDRSCIPPGTACTEIMLSQSIHPPPSEPTRWSSSWSVFRDAAGRTDPAYWQNLIFGGSGSLKDYYETVSYGAFSITPAAESQRHGQ